MPAILDKLNNLMQSASAEQILPVLNEIATRAEFETVRDFVRANLNNAKDSMAVPLNVAVAGTTGLVLGSRYFTMPLESRAYRVHPFLHQLRLAMLQCDGLRARLRENSTTYMFYPELHGYVGNLADRLVRVAYAHDGMDPSKSEFAPLYSLGGYFGFKETVEAIPKSNGRGTTCIMTARAFYHAAGAQMIGAIPPVVGTPGGAAVDLGRPAFKVNPKTHKTERELTVTYERFVDTTVARPPLAVGDIYMIAGHGQAQFLGRPDVRDLAVHVGLIVAPTSKGYLTVDGGQESGNSIRSRDQTLKYVSHLGWVLYDDKSEKAFTGGNLDDLKGKMDQYNTDAAVDQWIAENPKQGKMYADSFARIKKDLQLAKNDKQRAQIEAGKMRIYEQARRGIKVILKNDKSVGTLRTVQGWWRPDMFSEMSGVGDQAVLSKLM